MNEMIVLKIGERKYGMRKMPPIQGISFATKVFSAISKMVSNGNSLQALKDIKAKMGTPGESTSKVPSEISNEQLLSYGTTLISLLSGIDPQTVTDIFKEAFSFEVYCGEVKLGNEILFNDHFSKFPQDLYVVAIWATYNHVKDFFIGAGDGVKALMNSSGKTPADIA